jgi:3-methylcrotonyl-CoA carboxylase alpha subunit
MGPTLILEGSAHTIEILRWRPRLVVLVDGRRHEVTDVDDGRDGHRSAVVDGAVVDFMRAADDGRCHLRIDGRTFEIDRIDPRDAAGGDDHSHDVVRAPMPGVVVDVHRSAGEAVLRGEKIVTIESMKLQTALVAPRDGVVAALRRAAGETFDKDAVIIELEPLSGEA